MAYEKKYVPVSIGEAIPPNAEYRDKQNGKYGPWGKYYLRDGMELQTNHVIPPDQIRVSERKAWSE